jgi:hypothetical protein
VLLTAVKGEHPPERPGSPACSNGWLLCYRCRNRRPRVRFSRAVAKAKKRKLPWTVSYERWCALILAPCHWCAGPLDATGSGLDRLDDHLGYAPDNVVPACGACNGWRHWAGLSPLAMSGCAPELRALRDRAAFLSAREAQAQVA